MVRRINELLAVLNHEDIAEDSYQNPFSTQAALFKHQIFYLKCGLIVATIVQVALAWSFVSLSREVRNLKPIVVRVNQDGDVAIAPYASLAYQPREPEIRSVLYNFTYAHYARIRTTANSEFKRKLHFVPDQKREQWLAEERKTRALAKFIAGGDGEESEVYVNNVVIEDLKQQPYRATVYFTRVAQSDKKVEKFIVQYQFLVLGPKNEIIPQNPLGVLITYMHESPGFN